MSDIDSLVNSVHEGDAPEQKVTPPPQITTVTSLSAKFPYLKKGEYDIWAMKMQKYISSTDLQCWNIEDINMKFLRDLPPSWANIAQIRKVKRGLEYMSIDDLYNKLKCLDIDTKGYSVPPSAHANAVFVSSSSSSLSRSKLSYQETNGGTNSTVPADDAVPADDVPASAFISAEPTIPTNRVIAAEASVLAVDGIPADSEFAMISLLSKDKISNLDIAKDTGIADSGCSR
nr:hypothetical protein [Tanacetum cinerariifolium]